jgi:hypothetical protein
MISYQSLNSTKSSNQPKSYEIVIFKMQNMQKKIEKGLTLL